MIETLTVRVRESVPIARHEALQLKLDKKTADFLQSVETIGKLMTQLSELERAESVPTSTHNTVLSQLESAKAELDNMTAVLSRERAEHQKEVQAAAAVATELASLREHSNKLASRIIDLESKIEAGAAVAATMPPPPAPMPLASVPVRATSGASEGSVLRDKYAKLERAYEQVQLDLTAARDESVALNCQLQEVRALSQQQHAGHERMYIVSHHIVCEPEQFLRLFVCLAAVDPTSGEKP